MLRRAGRGRFRTSRKRVLFSVWLLCDRLGTGPVCAGLVPLSGPEGARGRGFHWDELSALTETPLPRAVPALGEPSPAQEVPAPPLPPLGGSVLCAGISSAWSCPGGTRSRCQRVPRPRRTEQSGAEGTHPGGGGFQELPLVQTFLEMNNPFLWEPPAPGRALLWKKRHEDNLSQHSFRLGSGRTGSQGHSWCDTDLAGPCQALHHFHRIPVPAEPDLSHSRTLGMACSILLPRAGLLSRCLWDVPGGWNNFQDLLFTARGAHSMRDTQGNACGATSESFLPQDHIQKVSPQSQKIPFHAA